MFGIEPEWVDAQAKIAQLRTEGKAWVSPMLDAQGAVEAEGLDAGVAAHYGSVNESRALTCGTALVDLSHLDILEMTGADRHKLLTTLGTQIVTPQTTSAETLFLNANGRVALWAGVLNVTNDSSGGGASSAKDATYLITEAGCGQALADYLERMKFMMDAHTTPADLAGVGFVGDRFAASGVSVWRDPWPDLQEGGIEYGDYVGEGALFRIGLLPRTEFAQAVGGLLAWVREHAGFPVVDELGYEFAEPTWAGMNAWETLRIASCRPRYGREVDERALPHEWDWLRTAVHLHKGCYLGQEAVARIVNLGRPPRRAVFLNIDGSSGDAPTVGDPIEGGGRQIGILTSVGYHHDDGWIGLGLVRRAARTEKVTVGGRAATCTDIVRADGKTSASTTRPQLQKLAKQPVKAPEAVGSQKQLFVGK
ncbi:MAG: folate-binding protein [Actinomycetaceae bacterium]|nr:folate-binding protein [Actinomycetaceae bacterium]